MGAGGGIVMVNVMPLLESVLYGAAAFCFVLGLVLAWYDWHRW